MFSHPALVIYDPEIEFVRRQAMTNSDTQNEIITKEKSSKM